LPAQAAAYAGLGPALDTARKAEKTLIMTSGFLAAAPEDAPWYTWAGLSGPVTSAPCRAPEILVDGRRQPLLHGLDLEADLRPASAKVLLEAVVEEHCVPFLTECTQDGHTVVVLNVHTFSEADFDAAGEMLLAPRPLGLLEIPPQWAEILRRALHVTPQPELRAPARVTLQPLGERSWFLQNYNEFPADITLTFCPALTEPLTDAVTGRFVEVQNGGCSMVLAPRARCWLRSAILFN